MKKILLYEVIKLVIALGAGILLFTFIPVSIALLLLPVDIAGGYLMRSKISPATWIGTTLLLYVVSVIFFMAWIVSGHTGPDFLINPDSIWR